jgi:hypothetical protein
VEGWLYGGQFPASLQSDYFFGPVRKNDPRVGGSEVWGVKPPFHPVRLALPGWRRRGGNTRPCLGRVGSFSESLAVSGASPPKLPRRAF